MEIVWVTVLAAGMGLVLRYLLPHRDSYGLLLLPAVAAVVTTAVWAGLVWLGWTFDGGWIWVVSFVVGGLAALATALALPRTRAAADARLLAELSRGRA